MLLGLPTHTLIQTHKSMHTQISNFQSSEYFALFLTYMYMNYSKNDPCSSKPVPCRNTKPRQWDFKGHGSFYTSGPFSALKSLSKGFFRKCLICIVYIVKLTRWLLLCIWALTTNSIDLSLPWEARPWSSDEWMLKHCNTAVRNFMWTKVCKNSNPWFPFVQ